jgi:hypothetical protein
MRSRCLAEALKEITDLHTPSTQARELLVFTRPRPVRAIVRRHVSAKVVIA